MKVLSHGPLSLTFLGTSTSLGVPVIGCSCPVCTSSDPRNQRWRASVVLEGPQGRVLIDAGPELRLQLLRAGLGSIDALALTHSHADHVHGLDDIRPLSFKKLMPVWADEATREHLRLHFDYAFRPAQPGRTVPRIQVHPIQGPFEAGGLTLVPVPIYHGEQTILGFRCGPVAYLTDCSGLPAASRALLQGLDTLIVGALRETPHPSHFSFSQAADLGRSLGVRQTWFTHLGHETSHEAIETRYGPAARPAYDGLRLTWEPQERIVEP